MRLLAKAIPGGPSSMSPMMLGAGITHIGRRFQYDHASSARGFGVANPPGADEPFPP